MDGWMDGWIDNRGFIMGDWLIHLWRLGHPIVCSGGSGKPVVQLQAKASTSESQWCKPWCKQEVLRTRRADVQGQEMDVLAPVERANLLSLFLLTLAVDQVKEAKISLRLKVPRFYTLICFK